MREPFVQRAVFHDVKIPKENVLGDPAHGFVYLMQGLAEERLIGSVGYLSAAQLSFDLSLEFVQDRKVFGKPLSKFQNTQFELAALRTEIDVAQSYVDQCVAAHNAGELTDIDAAKAKLLTSELQIKAADLGVQLHGGAGYMEEYPICQLYQDERVHRLLAGTSEIMKEIIARSTLD